MMTLAIGIHVDATTERTDGPADPVVTVTIERTDGATDPVATMTTERADGATDLHLDATMATDDAMSHPRATVSITATMTKIIEHSALGEIHPLPRTGAATTVNKRHATNRFNGANR